MATVAFFARLRDNLGYSVTVLQALPKEINLIEFAAMYTGVYSFWDTSSEFSRQIAPVWDVLTTAARYNEALDEVRRAIREGGDPSVPDKLHWQDAGGAFSEMNFMHRKLYGSWHLDHGLVASLIRLWQPASDWNGPDGCHTTVVDFGAGGGHYCEFLNRTGEYCCSAYDGSPVAARHTGGAVQTQRLDEPFTLLRSFDWVLCLEVAEHIPRDAEKALLRNLRHHARKGLVLSWSTDSSSAHPNARPWADVREAVESVGFVLDVEASAHMRTTIDWLKGAVHVFLVV